MAVRVMHWVWEHAAEVQGNDLLVLLALADWANDDGICWPSIPRLATKARVSVRTAQYIVQRLEARGYVSIERGGGRRHPNHYRVHPPHGLMAQTPQPPHPSAPETMQSPHPSGGATPLRKGAGIAYNGARAAAPEPLSHPPTEPSGQSGAAFSSQHLLPQSRSRATPAEAAWAEIAAALQRTVTGPLPNLSPPAQALADALGGVAALRTRRIPWPTVLGAFNAVCHAAMRECGPDP